MAKLPGAPDLGPLPGADRGTPYDTSGIARGGEALAQGIQKLGVGIANAGEGLGELGIDKNRFDYAKAHSNLLAGIIDQDAATKADPNYAPDESGKSLPNRHAEAVWSLQDQSAQMIQDPGMRERFMAETAPTVARSVAGATEHARALENNASVAYTQEQGDNFINKGIATPDEATRTQLIDTHNQLVDGLVAKGAITPVAARAMKQGWARQFATADLLHRADTDPQGVVNELQAAPGSGADVTARILRAEGTGRNAASSATGAGQFIDSTWLDVLKRNRPDLAEGRSDSDLLALRSDKSLGRDMTEAYRAENAAYLQKRGVDPTPGNQYLAHFLGPAGAAAVASADPNMPVADALAKAVGPKQAQAMVDANPSVLGGKLAGSVTQWAAGKVGGAAPGGGSIYDVLQPTERETLLAHAQQQLEKQTTVSRAAFQSRVQDATAEAYDTGNVSKPIRLADFVGAYGASDGPLHYRAYDEQVQTGRAINAMATMPSDQRYAVVESLKPTAGEAGYALKQKAYEIAQKAAENIATAIAKDPAGYAVGKLPASKEAYLKFADATGTPDMPGAARNYAAVTLAEQTRVGVPDDQRKILPASYVDKVNKEISAAADSDDPQKRMGLVARVRQEAALWGDQWPQVMRQLAPTAQPIVRAIAAGADPVAMTRLLSLGKGQDPVKELKEQSETKHGDLTKSLNDAMQPFKATLVGRQLDRDFPGYYGVAEKLAALYVRDGKSASDASTGAFNALIGNRYDFRDTYRIPKSAGVSPDAIQAGTVAARAQLGDLGAMAPIDDMPGRSDPAKVDFGLMGRNSSFVTSPDNSGLNLAYNGKFVRDGDGKPFTLSWGQLSSMGNTMTPMKRGAMARRGVSTVGSFRDQ